MPASGIAADDPATIRAANPVTVDHSELRRSLLPGHLRVIADNERQRNADVHAFEIGALHAWRDGQPTEQDVLGLVLSGRERPLTHDRPTAPVDVATAKGLLEQLASRLVSSRLTYERVAVREGVEHPGRTAGVRGRGRLRRRDPHRPGRRAAPPPAGRLRRARRARRLRRGRPRGLRPARARAPPRRPARAAARPRARHRPRRRRGPARRRGRGRSSASTADRTCAASGSSTSTAARPSARARRASPTGCDSSPSRAPSSRKMWTMRWSGSLRW